ncbi:hypothetical protein [Leptolyngbya sp. 7M]|nr:hypothetical protein [Leptolyngbya sp. 7M]QYO62897.1 hypothetical protein JVX88_23180 [Leptolyngbya sp. 7M]
MPFRNSLSVANIENLEGFTVCRVIKTTVGKYAIAIHQKQTNAGKSWP